MAKSSDNELCDVCRDLDFFNLRFVWLGNLATIFNKPKCPFCRLVTGMFQRTWMTSRYDERVHDSRIEEDAVGLCGISREEHPPGTWKSYIKVITPHLPLGQGPAMPIIQRLYAIDSAQADLLNRRGFANADVVGPIVDLLKVHRWLDTCQQDHPSCSSISSGEWNPLPDSFRVIDVQQSCLVQLAGRHRYLALSYVWGSTAQLMTKKSSLDTLSVKGALSALGDELSEVVRSAMEFVSSLGERYLWVDALCIVQDDARDREQQIPEMHIIYGNAFLTVVAASGNCSACPLPGLRGSPRTATQIIEHAHGIKFTAGPRNLTKALESSTWDSRGWTFQERLLSSRVLFFFADQVYFECKSGHRCELTDEVTDGLLHRLRSFSKAIDLYTTRSLSREEDIWNAFAAYTAVSEQDLNTTIRQGINLKNIHSALLWEPDTHATRRTCVTQFQGEDWMFPSWSWTGWLGAVHHGPATAEIESTNISLLPSSNAATGKPEFCSARINRGQSRIMCNVLQFETLAAPFRISHTCALAAPNENEESPAYRRNTICWKIFDQSSMFCGVALGLDIWSPAERLPDEEYECVLISKSFAPLFAMEISSRLSRKARPVNIRSKEDIAWFAHLRDDATDWPDGDDSKEVHDVFESREWAYLNVIVVRKSRLGDYYERVGIGQIHEDAWNASQLLRRVIKII